MNENQSINPYQIFNVEETGICIIQSKCPEVLALKGRCQNGAVASAERGSSITVVLCISASGIFIPPLLTFPRKMPTHN